MDYPFIRLNHVYESFKWKKEIKIHTRQIRNKKKQKQSKNKPITMPIWTIEVQIYYQTFDITTLNKLQKLLDL